MARPDLEFVGNILAKAVEGETRQSRIQKGLALRQQMHDAIKNSTVFNHYRMKWVSDSIDRVHDFAQGLCREFDAAHPDDTASIMDLLDILQGSTNLVLQYIRTLQKKQT